MKFAPQFKWLSCNSATYPPKSTCGPRVQQTYEFVLVTRGSLKYQYNGNERLFGMNRLILSRKGFNETFIWDNDSVSQHDYFHFNINHYDGIQENEESWPIGIELSQDSLCYYLLKHILKLGYSQNGESKEMDHSIFILLKNFIANDNNLNLSEITNLPKEVNAVLSYLSKKWNSGTAHAIELNELCLATHTSATQLTRVFKKQYQKGPIQLIRLMRLKRASIQLRRTHSSIDEIAHFNGFDNAFHFSKTFKKAFDLSPSYYRNAKHPLNPESIKNLPQNPHFGFN